MLSSLCNYVLKLSSAILSSVFLAEHVTDYTQLIVILIVGTRFSQTQQLNPHVIALPQYKAQCYSYPIFQLSSIDLLRFVLDKRKQPRHLV